MTDKLGCLANSIANSLFMVDRPPLEDFHSSAKSVICNIVYNAGVKIFTKLMELSTKKEKQSQN